METWDVEKKVRYCFGIITTVTQWIWSILKAMPKFVIAKVTEALAQSCWKFDSIWIMNIK